MQRSHTHPSDNEPAITTAGYKLMLCQTMLDFSVLKTHTFPPINSLIAFSHQMSVYLLILLSKMFHSVNSLPNSTGRLETWRFIIQPVSKDVTSGGAADFFGLTVSTCILLV